MTRTKDVETTIKSVSEADSVLKEIAQLEHRKNEIDNWANEEEQKIREEAKKRLLFDKGSGETIDDRIAMLSLNLKAFVQKNESQFDGKKRSMELTHGTIGFRLGTPKVATVGKISFAAIMDNSVLFKKLKSWEWIVDKPSMDKKNILSEYADLEKRKVTLKRLEQCSLTIEQKDEPYFETRETKIAAASMPDMKVA